MTTRVCDVNELTQTHVTMVARWMLGQLGLCESPSRFDMIASLQTRLQTQVFTNLVRRKPRSQLLVGPQPNRRGADALTAYSKVCIHSASVDKGKAPLVLCLHVVFQLAQLPGVLM